MSAPYRSDQVRRVVSLTPLETMRIASAFVKATENTIVSKRFAKKQQMQWSRRGAHLLLQTRTRALDGSLRAAIEQWYPGMMNDNNRSHRRAVA